MDDMISRRAVLDKFEPWLKVKDYNDGELNMLKAILYEIRFMPPATDKNVGTKLGTNLAEVGTDAISRDAVKELLNNNGLPHHINPVLWEELNDLPSAQPKRGRWIKLDMHRGMADYKCTACKQECYVPTCMGEPMYAFCPNCGAKMEVTNE